METKENLSRRGLRKFKEGRVVSDKASKTIVVSVTRKTRHATYGKFVRKSSKCYAHDEREECGVGDLVQIEEARPLSRLKRWKVVKILSKAG